MRTWARDNASPLLLKRNGSAAVTFTWLENEAAAALTMTALVSSRNPSFAIEADVFDCGTWARNDFAGMYMR